MKVPVYRLSLRRERTLTIAEKTIGDSRAVVRLAQKELFDAPHERMIAFFLNAANDVIGMMTVGTVSGISRASVCPKGIAQGALTANASAVILAHNHPSGDPTPSSDDLAFTSATKRMLAAVDTPMLDHVIVTRDGKFRSWSDDGEWGEG